MILLKAFHRKVVYCIFTMLNLARSYGVAQNPVIREPDINRLIQEVFPVISEESNPEELFEFFFQLLNDPLDINVVNRDQLAGLLILDDTQIRSFFEHRDRTGSFLSLYELQALPAWDIATIQKVIPFLTVQPKSPQLKNALQNPTQHFLLTRFRRLLEQQRGFSPIPPDSRATTRYAGNPWQWYARYRYARTGAFSIGLTLEKDAGEVWNWAPRKQAYGVDFTSFHIQILNRGKLKSLTIGDYQVQVGQGLVLASGFSLGKGAEVIRTTYRSSLGIRPYNSVMEQGFFRGVAATYQIAPKWEATAFYSHKRRDGTIGARGLHYESEVITSFPTDGFHRTPTERNKHGNILEKNIGFHLQYSPVKSPFQAGLSALNTHYSLPVEKRALPYNAFDFKGYSNLILGLHASYRRRNTHLFGETARSSSGGTGTVIGVITALNKYWDLSVLARNYQRDFHTFYGNSFKEGSRPFNEQGIYSGIRYAPSKKWQHSAYVDFFHFPCKRYLVDTTSRGYGFLVHTLYRPGKTFKAYAMVQNEQKQRNNRGEDIPALPLANIVRSTAMINLEWDASRKYTLRTRVQGVRHRFGKNTPDLGFAIVQDATVRLRKAEFSGRVALFRTDSYDSRQYVFEKDVLYAFSIPSYYDHGTRHYLMIRYDVLRQLRVWVRWSQTRYSRLEVFGSGLDEIQGNTRSEVKFQAMYRF